MVRFNCIFILIITIISCGKPSTESIENIIKKDNVNQFEKILMDVDRDTLQFFNGRNILHIALEHQASKISKKLIEEEYKLNAVDSSGHTPLLIALLNDNEVEIEYLLEKEIDLDIIDSLNGYASMHYAIVKNDYELVDKLLKKGANPNTKSLVYDKTPLHLAVESNQDNIVELLLKNKATDTIKDINDNTVLDLAIRSNHPKISTIFFDKFSLDQKRKLFLNESRKSNTSELLSKWINQDWVTKEMLHEAFIFVKDTTIAKMFLDHHVNVKYISKEYEYGAIHHAAIRGDVEMLTFLLDNGADINQTSLTSKISPLMHAARLYDNINSLNQNVGGSSISVKDFFYDAMAMSKDKTVDNSLECVKTIIERKANIHYINPNKENALYYAIASKNEKVKELLLENEVKESKEYKELSPWKK
ncbi:MULTISPECIES: ankyrin repeat domain-containing protein [Aquimarina]|uniref:ankyrin repeat domain-containing protein n=1 Tax=Aquimarina TaxID=290174 RepID=UPI000D68D190|nr:MULTISPECIES: ankyrin repeat domain-containing protein [Aquimarina]